MPQSMTPRQLVLKRTAELTALFATTRRVCSIILADIIPNIYSTIVYSAERNTQNFELYIA